MTKQELLSEGYLEAYLTEDLPQADLREVESWLKQDTEVRSEYLRVQRTLELLAFHFGLEPSQVIKRTVMEDASVVKNLHISAASSSGWKLMVAASVLLTIMSAFTAFYFYGKWQYTDARMSEMIAQNLLMAENVTRTNQELEEMKNNLSVLISPEFSRIVLNGTANAESAKAVIYWNPAEGKVFLNSSSLGELPEGKQYQLWALVDGKPVDAGVFDPTGETFRLMSEIARADAFAVTIEPTGGSQGPSLETMQVYGAVSKG